MALRPLRGWRDARARAGAHGRRVPAAGAHLVHDPDSPVLGPVFFNERGPELSRGFKALKVWVGLKHHGRKGYAAAVEHDVAMARLLGEELRAREDFELLAEPVLSIVGFRYRPRRLELDEAGLDRLNRRIVNRLVASGAFSLGPTRLKGRTAMRVAIVNFRTQEEDVRALVDEAARAGRAKVLTWDEVLKSKEVYNPRLDLTKLA